MTSGDVVRAAPFDGDFTSWSADGLHGCEVASDRPSTARSKSRWQGQDVFILGAMLEGTAEFTDGASHRHLRAGSLITYPARAPFTFRFEESFRYVIVKVTPQELGVSRASVQRLAGPHRIDPSPFADALLGLLGTSRSWPDTATAGMLTCIGAEARTLLARLVTVSDERHFSVTVSERLIGVLEWIDAHLADPELDPEMIAVVHHMSVRHVHRLFSSSGVTCQQYILRRRLERVHHELLTTEVPVAVLGTRWGLVDPSHLARAFRREYGLSPRELRRPGSSPG